MQDRTHSIIRKPLICRLFGCALPVAVPSSRNPCTSPGRDHRRCPNPENRDRISGPLNIGAGHQWQPHDALWYIHLQSNQSTLKELLHFSEWVFRWRNRRKQNGCAKWRQSLRLFWRSMAQMDWERVCGLERPQHAKHSGASWECRSSSRHVAALH
jgi:hypothetical protein